MPTYRRKSVSVCVCLRLPDIVVPAIVLLMLPPRPASAIIATFRVNSTKRSIWSLGLFSIKYSSIFKCWVLYICERARARFFRFQYLLFAVLICFDADRLRFIFIWLFLSSSQICLITINHIYQFFWCVVRHHAFFVRTAIIMFCSLLFAFDLFWHFCRFILIDAR